MSSWWRSFWRGFTFQKGPDVQQVRRVIGFKPDREFVPVDDGAGGAHATGGTIIAPERYYSWQYNDPPWMGP